MVYIIHFKEKLHHARHYVGYTDDLDERIVRHKRGDGSKLIKAVNDAGIEWTVVRTFPGTRELERYIKNQKNTWKYCPICKKKPFTPRMKGII